jgi:hypothetical protein
MRARANLWSILRAIALLYTCGGICFAVWASSSIASKDTTELIQATEIAKNGTSDISTTQAAQGIAAAGFMGLGLPFVACTGIPLVTICALLAWRNRVGLITEKRHQEQIAAQMSQFQTMAQSAQAQASQAHIQFAQMQQSQPINPVIVSGTIVEQDLRPQLEAAKALIDAKQYVQARNLLKTISHPLAADWLATMDKMNV